MGNDPNYRHYSIGQPALRVYDGATLKRQIVFLQTENQIRASAYNWEPEFDCEDFRADDGTITEFPLGTRLHAEISFAVYSPEFSAQLNQGEGESFTERDWIYLLKAQQLLYGIYFYPHIEQAQQLTTDARFKCRLISCKPSQPDGKTYKAEWILVLDGVSVTTNPLDEF